MVCVSDALGGPNGITNIKQAVMEIIQYRRIQAPTNVTALLNELALPAAYVSKVHREHEVDFDGLNCLLQVMGRLHRNNSSIVKRSLKEQRWPDILGSCCFETFLMTLRVVVQTYASM